MAFGKKQKQKRACGEVPELGAIFMSNRATKEMCFNWKTFGLPSTRASFVKKVKAGMFLFLFEHETRKLYGVYQAYSDGAMNLSPEAFSSEKNKYPAQVRFEVIWYCKPLSEDEFRPAIKDNYFAAKKFHFGLSRNQVDSLLWLFESNKLRDGLLLGKRLPSHPSLVPGETRSSSMLDAGEEYTFRVQSGNVPENANDLELIRDLEKQSKTNGEVHGRLLIDGHRYIGHEDTDVVQPLNNCRREPSHQDRVNQVRDPMNFCCNSNNDYTLNSGVPYVSRLSSAERYDPDQPLLENAPATVQLTRFHEVQDIACGAHASLGTHYDTCNPSSNPLSCYCNSVPEIVNEVAVNEPRMPLTTCYFEPIISNSRSPHPAYLDNAVHGGPLSHNLDLFRGLKPVSENISVPSKTDGASIFRRPVAHYDPSLTIIHPIASENFQIGTGIESFDAKDALLDSEQKTTSPSVCMKDISNPDDINQDSKDCKGRRSVFSRLKPALDPDDEYMVKHPVRSTDEMVSEVMESLKGHYCQLVTECNSSTKQVDDDDNKSKIKIKKRQTLQSQIARYGPVASKVRGFGFPTSNEEYEAESEGLVNREIPRLNFKRRSEVNKTRNAAEGDLCETSSAILPGKLCKRRKLVRPSFSEKKLSNCDGLLDTSSVNLSLSRNKDVPLPHGKEQKSLEIGNLESGLLLVASVGGRCSDGQSGSSNFTNGSADNIDMGCEYEKHEEGQSLSIPHAFDTQQLPKPCNSWSSLLDDSVGGVKSSSQRSTLIREENERAELSLTLSGNDKKGGYDKDNISKDELGWSLKDPNFSVDFGSVSCNAQLSLESKGDELFKRTETLMMFDGGSKNHGKAACINMNVGMKIDDDDDDKFGLSTEIKLGGSLKDADIRVDSQKQQSYSVDEVGDNKSDESVELKIDDEDDKGGLSTQIKLGGSLKDADIRVDSRKQQSFSVDEVGDNKSDKSVELELPNDLGMNTMYLLPVKVEAMEDSTMSQSEVHEEAMRIEFLAEPTSAIGQATEVQYFEFLTE